MQAQPFVRPETALRRRRAAGVSLRNRAPFPAVPDLLHVLLRNLIDNAIR